MRFLALVLKRALFTLITIVAVVAILGIANFTWQRTHQVTRADLSVASASDPLGGLCNTMPLPTFWKSYPSEGAGPVNLSYNAESVSDQFAVYAALATNAYADMTNSPFDLTKVTPPWTFKDRYSAPGGLSMDEYIQDASGQVIVAIVFRGTGGWTAIDDNLTNASWFVGTVNPWDQYRSAREQVIKWRKEAETLVAGRNYAFVAVGHSLGGGLARHVAAAFPCTAAVVFDSSPVADQFELARPFAHQEVQLYDKNDPLSHLADFLFERNDNQVTNSFQYYGLNPIEGTAGQHGLTAFATSMSREAICSIQTCLWGNHLCPISKESRRGASIWCGAMPEGWHVQGDDLCDFSKEPMTGGSCVKK